MQSKEILTAPIADAITPSGVVDSPSACGAFIFNIMKLIPLTQGQSTMVDDWNYDWLNEWKWYAWKHQKSYYARRNEITNGKCKTILMHRIILNPPEGMEPDHIDRDGLNNQEYNLRNSTHLQNNCNKTPCGKSKYLGVYIRSSLKNQFIAQIHVNGMPKHLGYFYIEEDAARAYDSAAKIYHGKFANLNFK